jgi:glycosyltransferase involved in cell wall biosynthesis
LVAALDKLWSAHGYDPVKILMPRGPQYSVLAQRYRNFTLAPIGARSGHLWEQFELPAHARDGILINLGNTAPIMQKRQIVVIHDAGVFRTPDSYGWRFRLWYKWMQKRLVESGAQLVTVSHAAQKDIAAAFNVSTSRIALMTEGADHILRHPPDHSILARHGLQPKRYALAVGSLAPHKNLSVLSEAGERLAARGYKLAITGEYNPAVFSGNGTKLPKTATYVGRVDDLELRALYENACCFIFPSRYEGFGLPGLEAMACGCPVLAARTGSLMELYEDAALFFDASSPGETAAAINDLLDTPARAGRLQQRGLELSAKFTWHDAAKQFSAIFNEYAAMIETGAAHKIGAG